MTAIVLTAITDLGSFNAFLLVGLIAGGLQLILGFIKAGSISNYFPTNVIEGMLAGIGVIIFLKQIPHAFGYDPDHEGDLAFVQADGQNTFSEIFHMLNHIQPGSVVITLVSLTILIAWTKVTRRARLAVDGSSQLWRAWRIDRRNCISQFLGIRGQPSMFAQKEDRRHFLFRNGISP